MFKTLRDKLLFWFILLSSTNLIIVVLSNVYISKREEIIISAKLLQDAHVLLLKDARVQQNFLSYETKNKFFFEHGRSKWLDEHWELSSKLTQKINEMIKSDQSSSLDIKIELATLPDRIKEIDSVFADIIGQVRKRGFKDFSLEGDMRKHAHWLENNSSIEKEIVLSLRRHEKDYIIRNEPGYVDKLNNLVEKLKSRLPYNTWHPKKDSTLIHLHLYQQLFNEIVALDKELGIKDNTALKATLDNNVTSLELSFDALIKKANDRQNFLLHELEIEYLTILISLVVASILLSYVISRRITIPLTELARFITRFVDSNFTVEEGNPVIRSDDEIGKLTQNFTMMKNEVITRLKFFKQKVEERTAEVTQAYKELDTFFYRASHDFRRPITTFLGLAGVARISIKDELALQLFEKVTETATSLDKMLQKLQSISDVGIHQMEKEEISIRDSIDYTLNGLDLLIKQKKISVLIEVKPNARIITYPSMFDIIIENLIENSVFFSKDINPFIILRASIINKLVNIEVEDNGQGIEEEYKEKIYDMYFRANENSKGNGLGLYITKKAVEKLNGTIHLTSEHKQGTKFIVMLPFLS